MPEAPAPPPEFTIEPATWRDLGALRQLEQECFGRDAWPLVELIAVLTLPALVRLKAVVDDEMVAFVGGDPHPHEGIGWITTIGVKAEFRRRGIGSALLERCELEMNMPRVRLSVRRSNLAAQEVYLRAGYHRAEIWQGYYQGGEDGIVMEKRR